MNAKRKQFGLTLTELLVTMAIAAAMMAIGVPAARRLTSSLQEAVGASKLIAAALSNARAIAVREGRYAGVRFQQAAADDRTYLVYIIHDPDATTLANGFRVVDGRKPIALPEQAGVVSHGIIEAASADKNNVAKQAAANNLLKSDPTWSKEDNSGWTNANTFSVVFDKTGKLIMHPVRVRNKNGKLDDSSNDSVFNIQVNVDKKPPIGMFYQDDYSTWGLAEEDSRNNLWIYSKKELNTVSASERWSGYLKNLNALMVSPYTGELIGEQ